MKILLSLTGTLKKPEIRVNFDWENVVNFLDKMKKKKSRTRKSKKGAAPKSGRKKGDKGQPKQAKKSKKLENMIAERSKPRLYDDLSDSSEDETRTRKMRLD